LLLLVYLLITKKNKFFLEKIFLKNYHQYLCLTSVEKDIKLKITTNHFVICFNENKKGAENG